MKVPSQTSKLYAAGLFLLRLALLVFVQAAFNLNPIFSPSQPNQIVLLFTLSTFIFLVLLIFGFVLLRTVVKVWAERKQQKPGSKFKTTVLVSLVTLTLLPATCMFMFAFALLNRSIIKWFSVPVDEIFSASAELGGEWRRDYETVERSLLNHIGQQLWSGNDGAGSLLLDDARRTFELDGVLLLNNDGQILKSSFLNDGAPSQ